MRNLRPSAGIRDLPNGLEMYQGFLEYHTSKADITPGKTDMERKFKIWRSNTDLFVLIIYT